MNTWVKLYTVTLTGNSSLVVGVQMSIKICDRAWENDPYHAPPPHDWEITCGSDRVFYKLQMTQRTPS